MHCLRLSADRETHLVLCQLLAELHHIGGQKLVLRVLQIHVRPPLVGPKQRTDGCRGPVAVAQVLRRILLGILVVKGAVRHSIDRH